MFPSARGKTIESITKPVAQIIDDLEALEAEKLNLAAKKNEEARQAKSDADAALAIASQAKTTRAKFASLLSE